MLFVLGGHTHKPRDHTYTYQEGLPVNIVRMKVDLGSVS